MLDKIPAPPRASATRSSSAGYTTGLRRGEVVRLDREHWGAERGALHVLGKKRLEREWVTRAGRDAARA